MILTKPIHLWTSYPNPKPINCYNFSSYFSIKYYVSNGMMLWSMCTKNACLDISAPFGTMDPRLERSGKWNRNWNWCWYAFGALFFIEPSFIKIHGTEFQCLTFTHRTNSNLNSFFICLLRNTPSNTKYKTSLTFFCES